jgi:hypothetical protein
MRTKSFIERTDTRGRIAGQKAPILAVTNLKQNLQIGVHSAKFWSREVLVPGDTFDFSAYEASRESHKVVAVRLRVSAQSAHVGVSLSCRQIVNPLQKVAERPAGNPSDSGSQSWTKQLP